jgi:acetoin utilization deacetylase AcuC-like enzyme
LEKQTQNFQPQALVIALGVDALASDPHVEHNVSPKAFSQLAQRIKIVGITTVVPEGEYIPSKLGPKERLSYVFSSDPQLAEIRGLEKPESLHG